ncbi:uncharacterized protein L969DRAFT_465287 [Mixia osmundae IAM 14324]|uniref:Calcipressin n=1 Tax=Mixia osmundae (strain CBS 9802 / IAM 14324 / JCM 22182 / KY 12970) TaxID=764103 RepID=G7E493_MIXOS|nr:uncharacterized protein L969DRAFT_465287 [Mixia osmundae IAM 14324]KEI39749.1 hypothetical protein L969DRAFT_465287 [Mixia osmundae IAM 14324]GAA97653.1 hypothetical protein E5Q_04331 [Mixia osmundae IAM 14324]
MGRSAAIQEAEARLTQASTSSATNTLIVTGVPCPSTVDTLLEDLYRLFASYGDVAAWAPLKSLGRIICVYAADSSATLAKSELDRSWIQITTDGTDSSKSTSSSDEDALIDETISMLRVYAGPSTALDTLAHDGRQTLYAARHLPVPDTQRNFLISPPGSPPVGWEQVREDQPNRETLAHDLMEALSHLSLKQDGPAGVSAQSNGVVHAEGPKRGHRRRETVVLTPDEASGLPGVTITDLETSENQISPGISLSEAWAAQREATRNTSGISNVRATSDVRITPTGRPPLG